LIFYADNHYVICPLTHLDILDVIETLTLFKLNIINNILKIKKKIVRIGSYIYIYIYIFQKNEEYSKDIEGHPVMVSEDIAGFLAS